MKVFLKDLPKDMQEHVRSSLKGNGLSANKVNLYREGNTVLIEIKQTGHIAKLEEEEQ